MAIPPSPGREQLIADTPKIHGIPRGGFSFTVNTRPDGWVFEQCTVQACGVDGPNDCQVAWTPDGFNPTQFVLTVSSSPFTVDIPLYDKIDVRPVHLLMTEKAPLLPDAPLSNDQLITVADATMPSGTRIRRNPDYGCAAFLPVEPIWVLWNYGAGRDLETITYDATTTERFVFTPRQYRGFGQFYSCYQSNGYGPAPVITYDTIGELGHPDEHEVVVRRRLGMKGLYPFYDSYENVSRTWRYGVNPTGSFLQITFNYFVYNSDFGFGNVSQASTKPLFEPDLSGLTDKFWDIDPATHSDPNWVANLPNWETTGTGGLRDEAIFGEGPASNPTFNLQKNGAWWTGARVQKHVSQRYSLEFADGVLKSKFSAEHNEQKMWDSRFFIRRIEFIGVENFESVYLIEDLATRNIFGSPVRVFRSYDPTFQYYTSQQIIKTLYSPDFNGVNPATYPAPDLFVEIPAYLTQRIDTWLSPRGGQGWINRTDLPGCNCDLRWKIYYDSTPAPAAIEYDGETGPDGQPKMNPGTWEGEVTKPNINLLRTPPVLTVGGTIAEYREDHHPDPDLEWDDPAYGLKLRHEACHIFTTSVTATATRSPRVRYPDPSLATYNIDVTTIAGWPTGVGVYIFDNIGYFTPGVDPKPYKSWALNSFPTATPTLAGPEDHAFLRLYNV